ncbi:MAG: hypothetical protein Q8O67_27605 [Deltaproteobacteria bacterium]|nr:hypothetical protein [Deltaproteobacteria bacterium]
MGAAVFNIVLGIGCIIGGLSGKLTLMGTNSGVALIGMGIIASGIGVYQVWRGLPR